MKGLREPIRAPSARPADGRPPAVGPEEPPPVADAEVLDLGRALAGPMRRYALVAGIAVAVLLVGGRMLRRGRRSSITLRLDHSW